MQLVDAIAEILKREGVEQLFAYPTTPLIDAAARAGIVPVLCRQERVGIDIADGYARVMNGKKPAVFAMQYGPGVENAYAGIATAYSDSAPVLLLPMAHERDVSQLFPLFSARRAMGGILKSVEEIVLPEHTPDVMRRAFSSLRHGRFGPVMVEIPRDIGKAEVADGFAYRNVAVTTSAPCARDVEKAARMLVEARCPIIQAGQGVLYAEACVELAELAELLNAPVLTTVDGKSAFPETHPLSLGTAARVMTGDALHFWQTCDVIFGVGTSFTKHQLTNRSIPSGKRLIHSTNDTRDLHKSYQCDIALLGDAREALACLIEAVKDRMKGAKDARPSPAPKIASLRSEWLARWHPKLTSSSRPMTPYRVISEFARIINPDGAIVTHDSGSPRDQMLPFYKATAPRSYLGWGKSHQLGTGLGLAIGAKIAAPDKFCVNFMGDAAFGMTGLDFETAVRCKAPVCTIVLNNSTMAIETHSLKDSHDLFRTRDIGGDYANLARALGGWGKRVEDPEQIASAILEAKVQTELGRPALLEFITNVETEFSNLER